METVTKKEIEKVSNVLNELRKAQKSIKEKNKAIDELNSKIDVLREEIRDLENLLDSEDQTFDILIPEELRTIRHIGAIKKIMGNIRYIPIEEMEAMAEKYDHGCLAELPELELI